MKDAARLVAYFSGVIFLGAEGAPPLFWAGQSLARHGQLRFLAKVSFESFFHRSLLVAAVLLLWPLLRSLRIRRWSDLGLVREGAPAGRFLLGFAFSAVPFALCAGLLLLLGVYKMRPSLPWGALPLVLLTTLVVPALEETLFRGFILGIFLRSTSRVTALLMTSGIFAAVHFLKAPENAAAPVMVTWTSGWSSVANAFWQFREPVLLLAGFTTLFLIACILADARLRTRSLWLPMGLHAGWIFVNSTFSKMAHREILALPWVGKTLLVGVAPLTVAAITWLLIDLWFTHVEPRNS